MASDGKARGSKKQTIITFTLPMSCQICLGKVKQPVLCPNHHVFCQLCLTTWLERNNQCPACRVDIGPENPVKHIIGGHLEDEQPKHVTTPDLRRTRFDLLYKEYEDQLEALRKENLVLRTENNILAAQLKDAEGEKDEEGKTKSGSSSSSSSKPSDPDGPSLLQLTKNIQEAQKLYEDIKDELSSLKQENNKLKDENVNLTRENENLRLEVAQRSPKKYGRYTVAALETKVAEAEKEIRQLKLALERSDIYMEELEQEIAALSKVNKELKSSQGKQKNKGKGGTNQRPFFFSEVPNNDSESDEPRRFKINLSPAPTDDSLQNVFPRQEYGDAEDRVNSVNRVEGPVSSVNRVEDPVNSVKRVEDPVSAVKRVLFGKVITDENDKILFGKNKIEYMESEESERREGPQGADRNNSASISVPNGFQFRDPPLSNDIREPSGSLQEQRHDTETDVPDSGRGKDKTQKKVHFNLPQQQASTSASSFDLEMPSPFSRSGISDSDSTLPGISERSEPNDNASKKSSLSNPGKGVSPQKVVVKQEVMDSEEAVPPSRPPATEFDDHVRNLLRKSGMNTSEHNYTSLGSSNYGTSSVSASTQKLKSGNDSSRLSLPESESPDKKKTRSDNFLDFDLDSSMTPEISDCLRLMDRAEKSVHGSTSTNLPNGNRSSTSSAISVLPFKRSMGRGMMIGTSTPRTSISNSTTTTTTTSVSLNIKEELDRFTDPPSLVTATTSYSGYSGTVNTGAMTLGSRNIGARPRVPPPSAMSGGGTFSSQQGSISSWQNDFYSTLKANPYRYSNGSSSDPLSRMKFELGTPDLSSNSQNAAARLSSGQTSTTASTASTIRTFDYAHLLQEKSTTNNLSNPPRTSTYTSTSTIPSSQSSLNNFPAAHSAENFASSAFSASLRQDDLDESYDLSASASDLDWPDTTVSDIKAEWPDSSTLEEPDSARGGKKSTPKGKKKGGKTKSSLDIGVSKSNNLNMSSSSLLSDPNGSAFLSEPKKRLFDSEDDLSLPTSPSKTTKKRKASVSP